MGKRTREIVAVALLVVLGFCVLGAMGWYILVGHNWNTAASYIDDSIGEMDGYTVILFEGTTPPDAVKARVSASQPMLDDENRGGPQPEEEDAVPPVTADDIASSYRQKGANVFVIHPETPQIYDRPLILNKNGFWVGVFHSGKKTSRTTCAKRADLLEKRGCNLVIEVAENQTHLQRPIQNVDVTVFPLDAGLPWRGASVSGTLNVDSPKIGEVQAVVISPSNTLSTRTATEP